MFCACKPVRYTPPHINQKKVEKKLMKWITLGVCTALSLVAIACNQPAETTNSTRPATAPSPATATATPDELAAARLNFQKNCQACHGETGEGGDVTIEGKRLKVPSFKAPHALKDSDEDFIGQINKGGDGMPAFKDKLRPEEITDLVKFIRKQFQGK
jgi:mono/diheme cytochrome c family protein